MTMTSKAPDCPVGDPSECPVGPDRRREDPRWAQIHDRMEGFDAAMRQQAQALAENTSVTNAIKANTDEIVQFFEAGKGFFAVVRWTGVAAKWVTTISAALVVLWAVAKFGLAEILKDPHK